MHGQTITRLFCVFELLLNLSLQSGNAEVPSFIDDNDLISTQGDDLALEVLEPIQYVMNYDRCWLLMVLQMLWHNGRL